MTENDETTENEDEVTYVQRPQATFKSHLFRLDDVREAGGDVGETSETPVSSICSRRTNYGEFETVERDCLKLAENVYCGACLKVARADDSQEDDET
jgi:hypothetical protein